MKILIAIASCQSWEDNGNNQAVRDTWLKDVPGCTVGGHSERTIDCSFFQGAGSTPRDDLIIVDAPDDYLGITRKTHAIHTYAYQKYDFVFQCWPDTYVSVPRLLLSGFEKRDYLGHIYTGGGDISPYGFLVGGDGWWSSRRANEVIMKAKPSTDPLFDKGSADDLWVACVLGKEEIRPTDHPGYSRGITIHGSVHTGGQGKYDKEWMYRTYDNR